jgi:hypothetical protein
MKWVLIAAALICSVSAFAQTPQTRNVGSRPLLQTLAIGPTGCKLAGVVKVKKIWDGDCEIGRQIGKVAFSVRSERETGNGSELLPVLYRPGQLPAQLN